MYKEVTEMSKSFVEVDSRFIKEEDFREEIRERLTEIKIAGDMLEELLAMFEEDFGIKIQMS